jgi:lysine-N-methylase
MTGSQVRAPRYLGRFRCIGSACEDHCCGGWGGIDVDPPTAEAYRTLAGRGDRRAVALDLLDNLEPNPDAWPDHGGEAALIPLAPGGSCPFLTGEQLCAIQGDLGEKLLSTTCDTFPRQATMIDDTIDLAGRFSCPEVVRLALLAEDALVIDTVEPDRRLRERGRYWIDHPWSDHPPEDDPRHHYHLVRARTVALLQRRDSSLAARMLALGLALSVLSGLEVFLAADVEAAFDLAERRLVEVAGWLDEETGVNAHHGGVGIQGAHAPQDPPLRGIPTGRQESGGERGPHRLLPRRLRTWIAMPNVPPRFRLCLDRVKAGLGLPDDATAPLEGMLGERVTGAYARARRKHLEPYLVAHPWLFENLLVNQVWLTTFPYHPERSFGDEHALLAFRVGLVRFQLVGAAAYAGALTDELMVETIQAFDKYVDGHDFWDRTFRLMQREQALDPASLAALLLA